MTSLLSLVPIAPPEIGIEEIPLGWEYNNLRTLLSLIKFDYTRFLMKTMGWASSLRLALIIEIEPQYLRGWIDPRVSHSRQLELHCNFTRRTINGQHLRLGLAFFDLFARGHFEKSADKLHA